MSTHIVKDPQLREMQPSVFDRAAVGLSEISLDGRFLRVNDELCRMLDLPREQLQQMTLPDVTHPDDLPRSLAALKRVIETDSRESLDKRYIRRDGSVVHANSIITRLDDEHGRPWGVIAVTADLTERRRAEQELREAKAAIERDLADMRRLHEVGTRLIGEHDLGAVLAEILDAALAVTRCDHGNIQLLDHATGILNLVTQRGFSDESLEAIGTITCETSSACAEALRRNERVLVPDIQSSDQMEPSIAKALLDVGIRALQCTPMRSRSGEPIGVISTHFDAPRRLTERELRVIDLLAHQAADMIDRLRSENALQATEERYRMLVSQVQDYAIFHTDEHGVANTWNEGCERVLGYTRDEFIGLDSSLLFTPEDRARGEHQRELHDAANSGNAGNDRWMLAKDGRHFFASGSTSAIYDDTGVVIGFTKVLRDQTEIKRAQDELAQHRENLEQLVEQRTAELEQTYRQLRMSERMASIGTLSAGLGHDMGNLLLPVNVRLAALKEANLDDELRQHVEVIETSARYLHDLSKGLRMLATDPASMQARGNISIQKWWATAGRIFKNVLPAHVRLWHHLPEQDCRAAISRAALTQAVFNLVQNAGDALRKADAGTVNVWVESAGESVTVGVRDNGPGMTEEVKRHCMEAYYSTKTRGISTGMGLALVRGLIAEVGGEVELETAPGQGATFRLILPAAPPPRTKLPARDRVALVEVGDARIRAMIQRELQVLGYTVMGDGKRSGEPSVIIVDEQTHQAHADRAHAPNAHIAVVGDCPQQPASDRPERTVHLGSVGKPSELRAKLRQLAQQAERV